MNNASAITLASLAHHPIWVAWRQEARNGQLTKLPYDPRTGRLAAVDDPGTWATYDEAQDWAAANGAAGVGLMFGQIEDAILCGVDLDTCRDPETEAIKPWAQVVIDRFNTYAEVSPSRRGVKLFCTFAHAGLADVEKLFDRKYGRSFKNGAAGDHPPAIEIHRGHRYFAVTEEMISETDDFRLVDLADLQWLILDHGPKFARQGKKTSGASSQRNDKSRSAKAFRAGAALKASGASYDEMRDGLLQHANPEIADWANTKGMNNGERELRRIYDNAWKQRSTVKVAGVEKRLAKLDELNDRFALLVAPGKPSVWISRLDRMPIHEDDLKRRLANEVVLTGVTDDKPAYKGAFEFWTGHARRHVYRRVAFTNRELPSDTLNLFRGLGVTPREGCCDRILAHIREVICSSDAVATDGMLKLNAWQMQNIGKPSRVIVIVKTKKHQAGKGALLGETMLKIYGPAGFAPAAIDQVLGRFNDPIVGRVYIFLDEVMFSGDRRAADAIKSLATATIYGIETKGLPIIQCPVGVNFWAATNHEVAAFIEESDVRYWVLDVSEHRVGDTDYFTKLIEEIENGGREAFAHRLLNMDVSGFVPLRDVPKNNAAKREMIKRTINPFDARKWIEECCETRQLIGYRLGNSWAQWKAGEEHAFHVLANAYTEWQKGVRSPVRPEPTPIGSLGEVLTTAGFAATRTAAERRRKLPDPDACLDKLYEPKKPTPGQGATAAQDTPGDGRTAPLSHLTDGKQ